MEQSLYSYATPAHYLPAVTLVEATFRYSLAKLPVARSDAPDHVCGTAVRVGYTGKQDHDLAIYRLKVKARSYLPTITLPGFFVVENGVFVDYHRWLEEHRS